MFNILRNLAPIAAAAAVIVTATPAHAEGTVMFNYQGRVKVQGVEHDGNGVFKFAILSPNGKSTLWSNDSTSTNGTEPTTGITLAVTDGVFNVLMGDNGLMEPINSTVFQTKEPLKLRTWFNDGINGFQQLTPDHNLINTNLIVSQTGDDGFTIFVDGANGDDSNSGLNPDAAKKTIQAAIDTIPSTVRADITIDIADGIYPEHIQIYGISVKPGKFVTLVGDESWTNSNPDFPAVVITGGDNETAGIRNYCIEASQCSNVKFDGLTLRDAAVNGIFLKNGEYFIEDCVTTGNGSTGINVSTQAHASIFTSTSTGNKAHGFSITRNSIGWFSDCKANDNMQCGLAVMESSSGHLDRSYDFSNNNVHGILAIAFSGVGTSANQPAYVRNNKEYGIVAGWNSYFHNFSTINITGNIKGPRYTFNGGQTEY